MTLYATFNSDGSISSLQRSAFDGGEPIDTATSAPYAVWFKSLPAFITDGWPSPGV